MAKKKYYAVRVGRTPGIYDTWAECEREVKGYPGAAYKSFELISEAEAFMSIESEGDRLNAAGHTSAEAAADINASVEERLLALSQGELVAFVDGSFDVSAGKTGYGAFIIAQGGETEELSGCFCAADGEDFVALRNVAGELSAAKAAVSNALGRGAERIYIYYDYAGIEKWVTGEWKTNRVMTAEYAAWMREKADVIDIVFVKVPAHSGVEYNEKADELARVAVQG